MFVALFKKKSEFTDLYLISEIVVFTGFVQKKFTFKFELFF